MADTTSSNSTGSATSSLTRWGVPIIAGLIVAGTVFALLYYNAVRTEEEQIRADALRSLDRARARLEQTRSRAAAWAEQIARQLTSVPKNRAVGLLSQYAALWPEINISLYDRNGELMPVFLPGQTSAGEAPGSRAPVAHTVRAVVAEAVSGKIGRGITRTRGFLGFSTSAPLHEGSTGALVLTVPLDSVLLERLKAQIGAEVAVVPLDEAGKIDADSLAGAAGTFAQSSDRAVRLWSALAENLPAAVKVSGERTLYIAAESAGAGIFFLSEASGLNRGLLVAAPLDQAESTLNLWQAGMALSAGIAATVLTLIVQYWRMRLFAADITRAISTVAEESSADLDSSLPFPLREALHKIGDTLQQSRQRVREAERKRQEAVGLRRRREDDPQVLQQGEDEYLRLFGKVPVGAFQAQESGRFIRVNEAFALLLGYDSPGHFLAECVSFNELFLYGGEFLNPLNALAAHGSDRQVISLRRKDGKVRHFALVIWILTTPKGDRASLIEGFLLDRELDEQKSQAERERDAAKRERASLALLLAATCRQTRSFLESSYRVPDGLAIRTEENAPDSFQAHEEESDETEYSPESALERRRSLLTLRMVLNDIYQVAMSELDSAPPMILPLEFGRFLQRTCRRSLSSLQNRRVSLRCDVDGELLRRLNGPIALLRHALQRSLLAITSPMLGGWACISARRDPNAPKSPGFSRVLFTISWSATAPQAESFSPRFVQGFHADSEQVAVVFDELIEYDDCRPDATFDSGGLAIADEQEVLRFLIRKMHGDLLESTFTADSRSIQFIVPLVHMNDDVAAMDSAAHEAVEVYTQERTLAARHEINNEGFPAVWEAGRPEMPPSSSLELLAMDHMEPQELFTPEDLQAESEQSLNVLLVEESLNSRLLFSLFLRETSHRITEAHDGQEGVEAFQRHRYDVIFMDMEMPFMDGYQATRIIRAIEADKRLAPTAIVAMTAYALPELQHQCMLAGCTDFIAKPFSKNALFSLLDALQQMKEDREPLLVQG